MTFLLLFLLLHWLIPGNGPSLRIKDDRNCLLLLLAITKGLLQHCYYKGSSSTLLLQRVFFNICPELINGIFWSSVNLLCLLIYSFPCGHTDSKYIYRNTGCVEVSHFFILICGTF